MPMIFNQIFNIAFNRKLWHPAFCIEKSCKVETKLIQRGHKYMFFLKLTVSLDVSIQRQQWQQLIGPFIMVTELSGVQFGLKSHTGF